MTYGMLVSSNFPRLLLLGEISKTDFMASTRLMMVKNIPVFGLVVARFAE